MFSLRPTKLGRFLCFALMTALWVGLVQTPIAAQLFNPPQLSVEDSTRSDLVIQRQGDIEYAEVTLDGMPILTVAAPAQDNEVGGEIGSSNKESLNGETVSRDGTHSSSEAQTSTVQGIPTIQMRVDQIETNLVSVLFSNIAPDGFRVITRNLNNQSVIFVTDREGDREFEIATITDLDIKLSGETESEVLLTWADSIRDGLTVALKQRQPQYLWRQARDGGQFILGVMVVSLLLAYGQRLLKRQWNWLHHCDRDHQLELQDEMKEDLQGTTCMQDLAVLKPLKYLSMRLPQMSYARRRNINLIIRRLLQWLQLALWLGTTIWVLTLFPQTREFGIWLSQVPVQLLMIILVITLVNKLGAVFIDYCLEIWAEHEAVNPLGFHRQASRAPTFSVALKGLLSIVCLGGGLLWTLYELRVPIAPVLTGAGILGFALSLSAQNLIKDIINGCLILVEDQYAVGDVIAVEDALGFVERMNLRITQLRNPDGELVTIPNGTIKTVRNLSNGWSRVNFEIEVSYATDVERAMEVMEDVIEEMRSEELWGDRILEPPEILGVDKLAHTGILIRIWIKTRPLQQWNVSREFRRRLKRAFESHKIPIGVPQQFLWVKNASELATIEQAVRSNHSQNNGQDSVLTEQHLT